MFKVGSRVFWTNAGDVVGIGTVVNIIPSGSGLHGLTLYEVEFGSDVRKTLQGSELY